MSKYVKIELRINFMAILKDLILGNYLLLILCLKVANFQYKIGGVAILLHLYYT